MEKDKDIVVLDAEEAAKTFAAPTKTGRRSRQVPAEPEAEDGDEITSVVGLLTPHIHTWTSPYNKDVVVRFRRQPAGADDLIARVLGEQSEIPKLVRRYKALLSVVSIGRDPSDAAYKVDLGRKNTLAKLNVIRDRIGFVGPEDDDTYDEPVNVFVFAHEAALYPEQVEILSEVAQSGLSPEDVKRIVANSGLQQAKK